MLVEINQVIVRRYFEQVWNKGDMRAAHEVLATNFSACSGAISGLEAAKLYISSYREAYPRTRFTILGMRTEEDLVTVCWASIGTHTSADSPTTGMSVYRLSEGKLVEAWATSDELGSMRRLGVTG